MPWQSSEAKSHTKEADTPEKRKKWAKIANSALKTAQRQGKSSGEADGYAIRIANSAMHDRFWDGGLFQNNLWTDKRKKQERFAGVPYVGSYAVEPDPDDHDNDETGRENCPDCNGTGTVPEAVTTTMTSGGASTGGVSAGETCPTCGGTGSVPPGPVSDAWSEAARQGALGTRRAKAQGRNPSTNARGADGQPSIHEIATGMGFEHQPSAGDAPHLDPFQSYTHPTGVEANQLRNTLTTNGFQQPTTDSFAWGDNDTFTRTCGDADGDGDDDDQESVTLSSPDGGATVNRLTHYRAPDAEDEDEDADDDDSYDDFGDALTDRDFSTAERKNAAEEGAAMPDGSFPIKSEQDLKNALRAVGRANDPAAAKRHIKKRARALGLTNVLPDNWGDSALPVIIDVGCIEPPAVVVMDVAQQKSLRLYDSVSFTDLSSDVGAKFKITQDGYLSAYPRIARSGIQVYRGSECNRPEQDLVRIYRPPEEVFHADAYKSYTHLPVTLDHPSTAVHAGNWKDYAVGETSDEVLRDGQAVRVPLMLRDSAAVAAFKDGKNQLSVGYDCDLDWTAGKTADGDQYDAVQRNIRANHLAVVSAARGGPTLRIGDDRRSFNMATQLLMIDGIKVELPDYAAAVVERKVQSLSDTIQELKARDKKRDEEDKKRDDEDDEREEDNAKKDAAIKARDAALKQKDEQLKAKDAQIATLGKQLDENKLTPEKINRAVTDRIGVITKAKQLMGDSLNCDEKTDGDIRRTVVLAKVGESAKGWTDPQVEAAFAVIDPPRNDSFAPVKASEPRRSSLDSMVMAFSTPGGTVGRPGDGYGNLNGPSARDGAYMEYDAHLRDAWKGAKAS